MILACFISPLFHIARPSLLHPFFVLHPAPALSHAFILSLFFIRLLLSRTPTSSSSTCRIPSRAPSRSTWPRSCLPALASASKKLALTSPPTRPGQVRSSPPSTSAVWSYRKLISLHPEKPTDIKLATSVRNGGRKHDEPGKRADPEKKALFSAATKVVDLSTNIGTEIVGLQLSQLSDQQKDEVRHDARWVPASSVLFPD